MDKLDFLDKCKNKKFKQDIIDNFHKLYYYSSATGGTWRNTFYRGYPLQKCPLDLWIYQELIYKVLPDFIIETGTGSGGSALYLADMIGEDNKTTVYTIDINADVSGRPNDNRIIYFSGSSISDSTKYAIDDTLPIDKVAYLEGMVVLDSAHTKEHVLEELRFYSKFVSKGSYLIVEDSNINCHPVSPEQGEGPTEAIEEFLKENNDFIIDKECEKFYMTFNPNGYLKRIK